MDDTTRLAELHFLDRLDIFKSEKPYLFHFSVKDIEGASMTNLRLSPHKVTVHNLRSKRAEDYEIGRNGFEWFKDALPMGIGADAIVESASARQQYCIHMEKILRQRFAARAVFTYQTVIRKAPSGVNVQEVRPDFASPIQGVHVDLSEPTAHKRHHSIIQQRAELGLLSAAEARDLEDRPFKVINTWRPLKIVKGWPLSICDFQSISKVDLVPIDDIHPEHILESLQVHFSPDQKWYYLEKQKVEEVFIFQMYDSETNWPGI